MPTGTCVYNGVNVHAGKVDDNSEDEKVRYSFQESFYKIPHDFATKSLFRDVEATSDFRDYINQTWSDCKLYLNKNGSNRFIKIGGRRTGTQLRLWENIGFKNDTCFSSSQYEDVSKPEKVMYIPFTNLYCDDEDYISLKEKPSGTCIHRGKQVNVGDWTVVDKYFAPTKRV